MGLSGLSQPGEGLDELHAGHPPVFLEFPSLGCWAFLRESLIFFIFLSNFASLYLFCSIFGRYLQMHLRSSSSSSSLAAGYRQAGAAGPGSRGGGSAYCVQGLRRSRLPLLCCPRLRSSSSEARGPAPWLCFPAQEALLGLGVQKQILKFPCKCSGLEEGPHLETSRLTRLPQSEHVAPRAVAGPGQTHAHGQLTKAPGTGWEGPSDSKC